MKNLNIFLVAGLILFPAVLQAGEIISSNDNFEIYSINFEPIQQGKNVVFVDVKNKSDKTQNFAIHIYTRSPDYGKDGMGWGMGFVRVIEPNDTQHLRFIYKIQGPANDNTLLDIKFINPESLAYNESEKPFYEKHYTGGELKCVLETNRRLQPAEEKVKELSATLKVIQTFIRNKEYREAWQFFSEDYKNAEFQALGAAELKKRMEPNEPLDSAFSWEKDDFLRLMPMGAFYKNENTLVLTVANGRQTWKIDFIYDGVTYKIDWIAGYEPRVLMWQDWEKRLLPDMQKRSTAHFDFYYSKYSTARNDIDEICAQREKGFQEICQFLGKNSDAQITFIFFEDEKTKVQETGHQGKGWAYGSTIVEVYNRQTKLDPYHEIAHVLMQAYGNPPALFGEGFAVYISEHLGANALEYLGGEKLTVHQRTNDLKNKGQWIPLSQLITYTEIGSTESKPEIAYPLAGSFVKFLIDTYGKDKFLQAYRQLKNSDKTDVQKQNIKSIEQICGESLEQLEQEWEKSLGQRTGQ
ncbi:MAG: hypothetical protein LLF92_03525 [Planctomycetaceae bacterium]|nr:hypothetical protein [Planctomycetaceae bacterium]